MRHKSRPAHSYLNLDHWILALTLGILPLVYSSAAKDPNLIKPIVLQAGMLLIAGVFIHRLWNGRKLSAAINFFDLSVILFALITSASWLYSHYRYASADALRPLFIYVLLYFAARIILSDSEARYKLICILLASSAVVSVIGVLQQFGCCSWNEPWHIGSTWFNRTYLAAYLLLLLPMAVWACTGKGLLRALGLIALSTGILSLAFTGSRIGWLAIFPMLGAAVIGFCVYFNSNRRLKLLLTTLCILTFCFVVQCVTQMRFTGISPSSIVVKAVSLQDEANRVRWSLSVAAVRIGLLHPIFGTGVGTYAIYGPGYAPIARYQGLEKDKSLSAAVVFSHAHNELLQVFAEQGIVGLLFYLLMLSVAGLRILKYAGGYGRKHLSSQEQTLLIALGVGLIGFMCSNLVGISVHVPGESAYFYIFFAMVGALTARPIVQTQDSDKPSSLGQMQAVMLLSLISVFIISVAWTQHKELQSDIRLCEAEYTMATATTLNDALLAVGDCKAACRLTPNSPIAWYDLGNALSIAGEYGPALSAFAQAEKLSPDFGRIHFNQATALHNAHQDYKALKELKAAYKLGGLPDTYARLEYLQSRLSKKQKS